jgi:hypothetical protein
LLEYVVNETRRVGGEGAPANASVFVENDCSAARGFPDCDHTDRLTLAEPLAGYDSCKVEQDLGGNLVKVNNVDAGSGPVCCFDQSGLFGRQVLLVKDNVVTPAFMTGAGPCHFRYQPIVNPPGGALDDAKIVLADVKTFYWEPPPVGSVNTAGKLVMHMDLDGDGSIVGERLYLASGVADFQVRLQAGMLGISIVAADKNENGVSDITTAFSTSRHLNGKFVVREATAKLAVRDLR